MMKTTTLKMWYKKIVKERNKRLKLSKKTGDYDFMIAHGLTEALRFYSEVIEDCLKKEDFDKNFLEEDVREICIKYHRKYEVFGEFMRGQTVTSNDKGATLYYGCDVEAFIKGAVFWD